MLFCKIFIFENFLYEFFFGYHWKFSFFCLPIVDIIWIIIPDMNIVLNKKTNIGLSSKEPDKFCYYSLPVYFFCGEKWKPFRKIISTLSPKETIWYIAIGTIYIFDSFIKNTTCEIKILFFTMIRHGRKDKRSKKQK
jgi:hypothetical protein